MTENRSHENPQTRSRLHSPCHCRSHPSTGASLQMRHCLTRHAGQRLCEINLPKLPCQASTDETLKLERVLRPHCPRATPSSPTAPRNSPRQAQRARQDLGQGFSHESSTRCAREERVGPRSASTRTRRGASAQKTGQRAPVWDRKRAAAAGFLGQERRADQARGAGAASRWQRRGTRSSGRAAAGSVDFASFTLSPSPPFCKSGFPRIHKKSGEREEFVLWSLHLFWPATRH